MTQDRQWTPKAVEKRVDDVIDSDWPEVSAFAGRLLAGLEADGLASVPVTGAVGDLVQRLRLGTLMQDDKDGKVWRRTALEEEAEDAIEALSTTPATQVPSPMDHWKRARVDPPAVAGLVEDLDLALWLIQEAKGAEGPNGGFVTNHLDAAENHIESVRTALAAYDKERG